MVHPVDKHVGQRLRHRRWLAGMTQTELGNAVGIKFQQIQKYESGANRISASRLWDLSNALQVPISFFFEEVDAEHGSLSKDDVLKDKETMALVRSYFAIPVNMREKLLDLAKVLGDYSEDTVSEADDHTVLEENVAA